MKETIKKYLSEFKTGIKTMFKEFFNKDTNKKQRANMWTFSRLLITIPILLFSVLCLINFSAPLLITNSILVAFGALTDFFDGKSARKHKSTSEFGKKLDQVTDKVFSVIIGGTLALINPLYIITLLGEAAIACINIPVSLKYKNINDSSSFIGRIKQWPLGASFLIGYLSPLTNVLNIASTILIIITFLLQIVTALSYAKRNIDCIKELKNNENSKLLDFEEDFDKTNGLEKTIGEKDISNNINSNINSMDSKKELCTKLRELKDEIIVEKTNSNFLDDNSFQKAKKF